MMTAIVRSVYTRSSLQPPRRAGLRFPSPVGHGRGLATRPGCAVPGEASVRLVYGSRTSVRFARNSLCATSAAPPVSGFTHARRTGKRSSCNHHRQPAAARLRSRLSLSAWGSTVPTQERRQRSKHSCLSFGVNRLPSSFALLGRGFTRPAVCANACHRPSIHRGSRLVFYRSPVAAMSSSHRLTAARFRSLPGEPPWKVASANTLAHPIIGPLCKVAEPCNPCRVYSPLRFAYGYITQTIIRRASWWRQFTAGPRYAFASVGFGQVRPWQAWQDAIYNKSPHPCRNRSAARSFRRSAPSLATRR